MMDFVLLIVFLNYVMNVIEVIFIVQNVIINREIWDWKFMIILLIVVCVFTKIALIVEMIIRIVLNVKEGRELLMAIANFVFNQSV